ncbi:unnamed protein product [Acanthosepion pharaonis]|uniref:Uncharacterized protein n=1 Tax=Acanthosepion pharaonis TaxID=158019 RepID=A0A812CVE8_ACAPH|nr:unnamed protein product [Sepia pharaonis]
MFQEDFSWTNDFFCNKRAAIYLKNLLFAFYFILSDLPSFLFDFSLSPHSLSLSLSFFPLSRVFFSFFKFPFLLLLLYPHISHPIQFALISHRLSFQISSVASHTFSFSVFSTLFHSQSFSSLSSPLLFPNYISFSRSLFSFKSSPFFFFFISSLLFSHFFFPLTISLFSQNFILILTFSFPFNFLSGSFFQQCPLILDHFSFNFISFTSLVFLIYEINK